MAAAAAGLECPVCYEVPAAHVHQCTEGHCFCAECDPKIENRLCPICREPLPAQRIRNIIMEQQIAALPETCSYCSTVMTRGVMAAHQLACAQRPRACVASGAGCKWTGLVAVQPAHEETCPFAVCQRMMAPLRAQNEELKTQSEQLKTQVEELQPLRAENQRLRARVAALEPLQARVAALEDGRAARAGGDDGGRHQRQRVGPAPHDRPLGAVPHEPPAGPAPHGPPPTDDAIRAMTLEVAVAALRTHVADAHVVERLLLRLRFITDSGPQEPRRVADAGVMEATVEAMRTNSQTRGVANTGAKLLWSVCFRERAQPGSIFQRAAAAGVKAILQSVAGIHDFRAGHCVSVLDWIGDAEARGII